MSALYSVTLHRRQLVSTFDAKGKKIDEREELIGVTFNDLPFSTAQAYKDKDPNAVITRQYETRSERSSFKHSGKQAPRKATKRDFEDMSSKPAAPSNISTGTYGALVSEMGK